VGRRCLATLGRKKEGLLGRTDGVERIVTPNIAKGLTWRFFSSLRMRKGKVEK
jgi:hypothetical protein